MLIALNAAIFGLGYTFALIYAQKQKVKYSEIRRLQDVFQIVLKMIKPDSPSKSVEDVASTMLSSRGSSVEEEAQLLTKDDIETSFEKSSWQRLAYEDLKMTILAQSADLKTFPCVYATMGYRSNEHRYIFLESDNPASPRNIRHIAPALKAYLDIATRLGPNTSLVIIGAPSDAPEKSVTDYNDQFWQMLRGLRILDPSPWPKEIPQSTSSEKWTFCFAGQPLFPVSLTPAHRRRWSRHACVPVIALQPKWVLEKLLSTPERRRSATDTVRKLLATYDQVSVSPDLTSYGQPGTSEIRQLCLMDENEPAVCPYVDFDR